MIVLKKPSANGNWGSAFRSSACQVMSGGEVAGASWSTANFSRNDVWERKYG